MDFLDTAHTANNSDNIVAAVDAAAVDVDNHNGTASWHQVTRTYAVRDFGDYLAVAKYRGKYRVVNGNKISKQWP